MERALRTEPARLVLALGGSSSMARWVEEAWVEVPWVDVPLDFLTMGVLGSRSSSWVKSGSCSTCRLSLTMALQRGKEEGEERVEDGERGGREGREGRERRSRVGSDRGKAVGWWGWQKRTEECVEQAVGEGVNALSLEGGRGVSVEKGLCSATHTSTHTHTLQY